MAEDIANVVIVGSGMAGLTAAIYTSRAKLSPLVLEGNEPGGQLTLTSDVENYPGFPDAINGFDLMQNIRQQAERFGTRFIQEDVVKIDLSRRPFTLTLTDNRMIQAHAVIVASGARARRLGLEAEERYMGRGVSTCATCDGAFYQNKVVAVVGGGDSAMEESMFLTRYANKVYVIHRRDYLRASPIMRERAEGKSNLEFVWNTRVEDIVGSDRGVAGLKLANTVTGEKYELPVDGLFLAIGHIPNTEWLQGQLETDAHGYIRVNPGSTVTKIPGVFVAGDVADPHYQQAVTAAGSGCMAALDVQGYLEEQGLA